MVLKIKYNITCLRVDNFKQFVNTKQIFFQTNELVNILITLRNINMTPWT